MRNHRKKSTDPRTLPGSIAGPGGPHDKNAVIVNTAHAVLLESAMVCLVEQPTKPAARPVIAISLSGRVNHTNDQAEVLFLMDEDGAALLVSQILALGSRIGPEFHQRFLDRLDTLAMEGNF